MLFYFLQYVSPAWYFNLEPAGNLPYFPDYDKIREKEKLLIELDHNYSNREVTRLDAAYQAWHKGFILSDPALSLDRTKIRPTVTDNYRFLRRYFHPLWSWYVLLLRLITLHNPLHEIDGFLRNVRVQRLDLYKQVYPHPLIKAGNEAGSTESPTFSESQSLPISESPSLKVSLSQSHPVSESPRLKVSESQSHPVSKSHSPKVSIIIPTLNRYPYLKDALHDLEKQDYLNFEVMVVDQSEPYQPEFYQQFHLDIKLIRQEEKALWLARNTAIQQAKGEIIAMYEDDVRVSGSWLSNHLACLEHFQADISAGVFYPSGTKIPVSRSFFRWADQFASGNACLKRDVFQRIGLFDRQFERQRMGDGEFGLRAYLAGLKSISNPYAWCEDVKAPQGGLRQMGSWDSFRPKSWLAPRPVPSVLYLVRKYYGEKAAINTILKGGPPSLMPYHLKRRPMLLAIGSLLIFPLAPLVTWQVSRSWRISSQMLKEGPKIEPLKNIYAVC